VQLRRHTGICVQIHGERRYELDVHNEATASASFTRRTFGTPIARPRSTKFLMFSLAGKVLYGSTEHHHHRARYDNEHHVHCPSPKPRYRGKCCTYRGLASSCILGMCVVLAGSMTLARS